MLSSGVLHHVAIVRTDISEECIASIIRVTRIGELGTLTITNIVFLHSMLLLVVTANVPSSPILVTLMRGGNTFLQNIGSYKSHMI
jgi:hypothetical protein